MGNKFPLYTRLLWSFCVLKIYKHGDGYMPLWRWWNPIYWLVFLFLIPLFVISRFPLFSICPIRVALVYRLYPKEIEFVNPWKTQK